MSYRIQKLQVTNFRNLEPDVIEFGPKINCIFGDNGNGKTNILEAIYVLTTKKSFRKNSSFPQYLGIDGDKPEILFSSVFSHEQKPFSLTAKMEKEGSQVFMDGRPTKKRPPIAVVFVNPSDAYQFHTSASFRRQWFDQSISQVNPEYKKVLNKYNSLLRNRNTLLGKKPPKFREQIDALDPLFAECFVALTRARLNFLEEVTPLCAQSFKEIFSEEHEVEIQLETKLQTLESEDVLQILRSQREKEEMMGFTKYGVHKDDYTLLFNGLNAYEFCSLGQQKMSYLSLLFAYIELFRYKFMSFPILLLDDVSGELDRRRWENLVAFLKRGECQVLITTANENFKEELDSIQDAHKIFVQSGSIS